ncbi:GTP pyrophosphokinase [Rhizobium leguminosarum]|uniref:GTP pyrophosphokinase n=1 Tax=Rhizobium leguminosarum TaxID=384 RepID=UPI001C9424B9|nr:GTP pyrophosphokinase [Rhizobium leguminosarum]MBY5782669.1 GTP pyrophosphokinase [Rhizobium leguminosarum]
MDIHAWIEDCVPKHERLTESATTIIKSLLEARKIDYLSISGRTKNKDGILEKIRRKKYKDPQFQMTDISGIRIIVFIESEVQKVSDIIKQTFIIDEKNSSNKDDVLSLNQVGYRSVHFVCDLGDKRAVLPEFEGLCELKFEFQIRTVLQHAWAELAHDRSYKFKAGLPKEIERKLYLHAGLLEIADKGFSDISREIDAYSAEVLEDYRTGNLDLEINSITLQNFIEEWAKNNNYPLERITNDALTPALIGELEYFGIKNISDINKIIPVNFADFCNNINYSTNIYGLVRGWLIIKNVKKLKEEVKVNWTIFDPGEPPGAELEIYKKFSSDDNYKNIVEYYNREKYGDDEDSEYVYTDEYSDDPDN